MTAGGFSPKRLTRVRDVLSRHVDAGWVPGVIAVVARHGEVHIEAMGNLAFEGPGLEHADGGPHDLPHSFADEADSRGLRHDCWRTRICT